MNQAPNRPRPLSPFMIGPYYRPQITSMMSIAHRGTGVILALASLLLPLWLCALAAGGDAYAQFVDHARAWYGKAALFLVSAAAVYHFLNGIRHLFWDAGKGYEIRTVYASGETVLVLAFALTGLLWFVGWNGGLS
jgi:succinate dehydrogenase / fumarate reductase cytochrome b subunit